MTLLRPALFAVLTLGLVSICPAQVPAVPPTDPRALADKAVAAVGGEEKLLKLFRIKELFHFGDKPTPPEGKQRTTRTSVIEPPRYWWLGKKDRTGEPAKFDVWAWTLGALTDPASKLEAVPAVEDGGKTLPGLRVSGTITPAMELYFDPQTHLLARFDWRGDIYRLDGWKEQDGVRYASICVIYKKSSGKPWFYHEVLEVERLKELPAGLERTPLAPVE